LLSVEAVQPPVDAIQHFKNAILNLEFEWHPVTKKVYRIYFDSSAQRHGEAIAHDIVNHGAAWNAVLIYQRGYQQAIFDKKVIANGP
jgi:hypothetical protein